MCCSSRRSVCTGVCRCGCASCKCGYTCHLVNSGRHCTPGGVGHLQPLRGAEGGYHPSTVRPVTPPIILPCAAGPGRGAAEPAERAGRSSAAAALRRCPGATSAAAGPLARRWRFGALFRCASRVWWGWHPQLAPPCTAAGGCVSRPRVVPLLVPRGSLPSPCRCTLHFAPTGVYASQTLEAAPFALADVLTVALYRLAAAFGPGLPKVSRSVWLPPCTLRFHSASVLSLLLACAWASCDGRVGCPLSGAAGAS